MKTILTLAKKEFRDFLGPLASVFIVVFLFLSFWLFFSRVFLVGQVSLRIFFSWLPILFIVFLPSVTMGKWADEKKTGTLELLMTLPVTEGTLIAGKLLSCVFFLVFVLGLTLPLPLVMSRLGDLDWGPVWGSYVGAFFLGLSYFSLGLFISSLFRSSIVAFLVTVMTLFLLFIMAEPMVTQYLPRFLVSIFQYASINEHYESLARGVLDSRDVVYFLSVTFLFLALNRLSLAMRQT